MHKQLRWEEVVGFYSKFTEKLHSIAIYLPSVTVAVVVKDVVTPVASLS
jgi:hypothetical protein